MVEKLLSSSCIRSITAVSLKPPPEPFTAATTVAAAASPRHRAYSSLPTIEIFSAKRQRRRVLRSPGSLLPSSAWSGRWKNVGQSNLTLIAKGLTVIWPIGISVGALRQKGVIGLFWGGRVHWLRKIFFSLLRSIHLVVWILFRFNHQCFSCWLTFMGMTLCA